MLANLLDNAIKYTDPGGRLGVQATAHDDAVTITVWDTGIGLASTDLPHIFERFYRVDKARSLRLGGTGLGLSIVKHLTESMGGSVSVESELGQGSRFTIALRRGLSHLRGRSARRVAGSPGSRPRPGPTRGWSSPRPTSR